MAKDRKEFMIEDARLIFINFSGKEKIYNQAGNRNFAIMLNDELAGELGKDGWNVKLHTPKHDEFEPFPYLPVFIRYDIRPPHITILTNEGRTRTVLDEDTVDMLDTVDIANVDLICNGYEYEVNGKSGVKAYLKTMFVTINEDALERKYANYEE